MTNQEYFQLPKLYMVGPIREEIVKEFFEQTESLIEKKVKRAIVVLSTFGGNQVPLLYDQLHSLAKVIDLTIVASGYCHSAGPIIMMALPRERRLALPNTNFLIHQQYRSHDIKLHGPLEARSTQLAEIKTHFHDDEAEQDWVYSILARGTGHSLETIKNSTQNGHYFSTKEAKAFGLIGGIVSDKA